MNLRLVLTFPRAMKLEGGSSPLFTVLLSPELLLLHPFCLLPVPLLLVFG
jgi:hypothetical protein